MPPPTTQRPGRSGPLHARIHARRAGLTERLITHLPSRVRHRKAVHFPLCCLLVCLLSPLLSTAFPFPCAVCLIRGVALVLVVALALALASVEPSRH